MEQIDQKLEYFCPFCKDYTLKQKYSVHSLVHHNDPTCGVYPKDLEEMKRRFQVLGMYDER